MFVKIINIISDHTNADSQILHRFSQTPRLLRIWSDWHTGTSTHIYTNHADLNILRDMRNHNHAPVRP